MGKNIRSRRTYFNGINHLSYGLGAIVSNLRLPTSKGNENGAWNTYMQDIKAIREGADASKESPLVPNHVGIAVLFGVIFTPWPDWSTWCYYECLCRFGR